MADFVLDASAIMAVIFNEPGEKVVRSQSGIGAASAVNISEVYARAVERGLQETSVEAAIRTLRIERHEFAEGHDVETARLRPLTRHLGISLADRACLALARRLALPVFTADRRWAKLKIGVDVRLIR
jgi:PIN domain nuclease of toxin-antitoxin system